jgi:hypothetical protein
VLEFAAFDDPEPVVAGGEGLAFGADPCGGDEDSGCGAFFLDGAGQGADIVGGDALSLDQDLGAAHDVCFVVGDGVDALVAGGLGDVYFQSHGLEQLADEVLEPVPVHFQQVGTRVDACKRVDRVGEPVFGFLELDDRLDGLQVVRMARQDRLEALQALGGVDLIEYELGEFSPAGGG